MSLSFVSTVPKILKLIIVNNSKCNKNDNFYLFYQKSDLSKYTFKAVSKCKNYFEHPLRLLRMKSIEKILSCILQNVRWNLVMKDGAGLLNYLSDLYSCRKFPEKKVFIISIPGKCSPLFAISTES